MRIKVNKWLIDNNPTSHPSCRYSSTEWNPKKANRSSNLFVQPSSGAIVTTFSRALSPKIRLSRWNINKFSAKKPCRFKVLFFLLLFFPQSNVLSLFLGHNWVPDLLPTGLLTDSLQPFSPLSLSPFLPLFRVGHNGEKGKNWSWLSANWWSRQPNNVFVCSEIRRLGRRIGGGVRFPGFETEFRLRDEHFSKLLFPGWNENVWTRICIIAQRDFCWLSSLNYFRVYFRLGTLRPQTNSWYSLEIPSFFAKGQKINSRGKASCPLRQGNFESNNFLRGDR